jgi:RHS repeat-associated protein
VGCKKLHSALVIELPKNTQLNYLTLSKSKKSTCRDYRYGFNGMEKDNEVKGEGNSVNYKARIQDTRLGRFLSVDPLTTKYPWYTPYQFAGNKPTQAIDLDGLEEKLMSGELSSSKLWKPFLEVLNKTEVQQTFNKALLSQNKIDVFYYTFEYTPDPKTGYDGPQGQTDYLSGATGNLNLSDKYQNPQFSNLSESDVALIKERLASGKGVIMIGLNKHDVDNAALRYIADKNNAKNDVVEVGETVVHEEDAHAKRMLKTGGDYSTGVKDHKKYFGDETISSPTTKGLKENPKYKDTKALKNLKQVEKAVNSSIK